MLSPPCTLPNRASRVGVRGAENRTGGFCRRPPTRARLLAPQTTKPRRVAKLAATKSASGPTVWLSRDPIGEDGGLNLYGYVGNSPITIVDSLGLAWESTPTQGLHYNDRSSNFAFGLMSDASGNLIPTPLGGKHTFDLAKANSILSDTIKDKNKWGQLKKQVASDYDNPAYRDKGKCSRLGKAMRLAAAFGAAAAIANAANSDLPAAAREYINARSYSDQENAALRVANAAAAIGVTDTGAVVIYNKLME